MYSVMGNCGKCGAPYWAPSIWHGITPPPLTPSCGCWNQGQVTTTSTSTADIKVKKEKIPTNAPYIPFKTEVPLKQEIKQEGQQLELDFRSPQEKKLDELKKLLDDLAKQPMPRLYNWPPTFDPRWDRVYS